jgi:hypothetical protein
MNSLVHSLCLSSKWPGIDNDGNAQIIPIRIALWHLRTHNFADQGILTGSGKIVAVRGKIVPSLCYPSLLAVAVCLMLV